MQKAYPTSPLVPLAAEAEKVARKSQAVKASRNEHISSSEGLAYASVAVGELVVLSIDYSLAYQDALRAVMEFNEREEMKLEDRADSLFDLPGRKLSHR